MASSAAAVEIPPATIHGTRPELRELQYMTIGSFGNRSIPSAELQVRTALLVERLSDLGINCRPPDHSLTTLFTWCTLERCFEVLAVLADARKLDEAKDAAQAFQNAIREDRER